MPDIEHNGYLRAKSLGTRKDHLTKMPPIDLSQAAALIKDSKDAEKRNLEFIG